ncbi:MAG: response regulator [Planctomycetes bacterium]|nr:response regulator [Planctomycetota bacterium]
MSQFYWGYRGIGHWHVGCFFMHVKSSRTTRTIVVADDDRLLRESLCDALSDLGCNARAAGNGSQAIEFLSGSPCDLLLSDVDMPDMSGFQLLSWVSQHHPLPMILMSARADESLSRAARSAGAITLLSKPVEITSITSLFHSLFDERPDSFPTER